MMKSKYFQAMGIIRWRLRCTSRAHSNACFYHLFDPLNQLAAILVAQVNNSEEEQLLLSLLQALNFQPELADCCEAPQYIFLGDAVSLPLKIDSSCVIRTHSLSEMLKEPLLKSRVWRDLQPFPMKINQV